MSIKQLKLRKYHSLNLGERFTPLMGEIEERSIIMLYGGSACGKSVFALQLADHLSKHLGKGLYNSHEEALNKTLQDRVLNFHINSPKLYFADRLPFEDLLIKIQRNHYRFIVIDSVQYMRFTEDQLKELRLKFKKRRITIILVSFGTSPTSAQGATELLHAADVKAYFKDGMLQVTSRYLGKQIKVRLFNSNSNQAQLTFP